MDNTSTNFWPEADIYDRLNSHARLLLFSRYTTESDTVGQSLALGTYVDLFVPRFKPVLFRRISVLDDARAKRITVRAGYRYVLAKTTEHRLSVDATLRWALRRSFLMSNRQRFEFRFIQGAYSWRYRNEVKLERDFELAKHPISPYLAAEVFYDSRYATISRWRYIGGVLITLNNRWAIEPYYTRQVTKQPNLLLTNAIGLKVSFFGP
jgi:hypothetical protein